MDSLSDAIAAAIRAERARRRWTQAELATRSGIPRSTIGDIEADTRNVTVDHLPALCRAFDVSLVVLLQSATPEDMAALKLRKRDLLEEQASSSQLPNDATRRLLIPGQARTVGRGQDADLHVGADRLVPRRVARIECRPDGLLVHNLSDMATLILVAVPGPRTLIPLPDITPAPDATEPDMTEGYTRGVTPKAISRHRPTATVRLTAGTTVTEATEISLSVVDRPQDGRWTRSPATIQVTGGSYTLTEAHLLARAVTELIGRTTSGG